jgi:hypothetical protein
MAVIDSARLERVERLGTVRVSDRGMTGDEVAAPSIAIDARVRSPTTRWLVTVDASGHAIEATLVAHSPGLESTPEMREGVLHLAFYPALRGRVPVTMSDTGPDALLSISSTPKTTMAYPERCRDDAEHAMKVLCMSLDKTTRGRRPKEGAGRPKTALPTCPFGTGECPLAAVLRPYAGSPRPRSRVRISKEA